jgi:hypothetical protein
MENLTRKILEEILTEKWVWDKGTPRKPKPPALRYHEIRLQVEKRKESMYYDEIMFPTYHRFVRLFYALIKDKGYKDLHFEEVDGNMFFGSDCPQCQSDVDIRLDKILYNYVETHPGWRQEYPTDEEIDTLKPALPTHQQSLF